MRDDPDSYPGRLSELERWREREVDPALAEVRSHLIEVSDERRIATRVADELRRRGISPTAEEVATRTADKIEENATPGLSLSWYQKIGAFAAGALLLADAIRGLIS